MNIASYFQSEYIRAQMPRSDVKTARHLRGKSAQLLVRLGIVGHVALDMPPEALTVTHLSDVTQLMHDNRIDGAGRCEHQPP